MVFCSGEKHHRSGSDTLCSVEAMAAALEQSPSRIFLGKHVDALQWMNAPRKNLSERLLALGCWNFDTGSGSVEISALNLEIHDDLEQEKGASHRNISFWEHHYGRVTQLQTVNQTDKLALISGSSTGKVTVFVTSSDTTSSVNGDVAETLSMTHNVHKGSISALDLRPDSNDCLTAGEDGKICIVDINQGGDPEVICIYDTVGTASFSAAKWTSSNEIVTASTGGVLQSWDRRRPGKPSSRCQFKLDANAPASIHSIDVHPSQRHLCAMGGSGGAVLAWDLRFPQQPHIIAVGVDINQERGSCKWPKSEVWQVKFDRLLYNSNVVSQDVHTRLPPVIACTQNGALTVIDGEIEHDLALEACGINCFDIDNDFGQDIICGLEDESLLHIRRHRFGW